MTRLVEILVAVNAALGIVTWLSVRWASRRKQEQRRRTAPTIDAPPPPRQLPPAPGDTTSDETRDR